MTPEEISYEQQSGMTEPDESEEDEDGWCVECGETFRYDDCGGYNPPCSCGFHCRSCHEYCGDDDDFDDDYEDERDLGDGDEDPIRASRRGGERG